MITKIIHWSIAHRLWVLFISIALTVTGLWAIQQTPVDAMPDISDVQVIVKTHMSGQSPQVVEDQVTYPLSTALMSVPGAVTVRGYSFFGDSYVYVIFKDDTDLYWARSRVLEYLNQISTTFPDNINPELGPDATGAGWVYLYALTDKTGGHDLSQLKSLQDWFLKYELQSIPGVSEVSTIGGMNKQYQVIIDPDKLRAYSLPLSVIALAINQANQDVGASVIEMAEAEYMVQASGYINSVNDLGNIPLGIIENGTPLLLKHVAKTQEGPEMRRGVAELNGEGEVVGGIIVMRSGENARKTIDAVKNKLNRLKSSLPKGIEIVTVYDQSALINDAVNNLWTTLLEELFMVALVCMLFLYHLRSSIAAIICLPIALLTAFIIMHYQGISTNIMSLGGMAIAIGAMIDGAIVFIENMHKHLEQATVNNHNRWQLVAKATSEVGPALFFGLLIITLSFLPVFTLTAQEGKMFSPLAYTKTYAMAASAGLAITLLPVLIGYCVRGRIIRADKHPINQRLIAGYKPILNLTLKHPKTTLLVTALLTFSSIWPWQNIDSEFIPPFFEGDLMYMPSLQPGVSIGKAREILQQTHKIIRTVPEVKRVFGKVGRAETATDPAPLNMIETYIQLKERNQWRAGLTPEQLKNELDQLINIPGVTNAWVMPIKSRLDMQSTGIKTPLGIKIAGADYAVISRISSQIESILNRLPETESVYAERINGGRYVDIAINRLEAARYGLSMQAVQSIIATAVGGKNLAYTLEGRERYPINMRYPQHYRDSPESIANLPIVTPNGEHIVLGDVSDIMILDGPPMIKSENARINSWMYIDIEDRPINDYVEKAQKHIESALTLPTGYSLTWSGDYENMARAKKQLVIVSLLTLIMITFLLYLCFRQWVQVIILISTLPVAMTGSLWFLYWMGYNMSIAVGVGFIALAGIAIETGIIMLTYLDQSWEKMRYTADKANSAITQQKQIRSIQQGAILRIRPVIMTASATIISLIPVVFGDGTGSEVMSRLAAPMMGGMVTTILLTLFVLPTMYSLWKAAYNLNEFR